MRASLHESSLVHDQDLVRTADGREAMRDDESGAVGHQSIEGFDDQKLGGDIDRFDRQMSVFTTSAHLLDDGVIDPRDTRAVLAKVLSICREAEARKPQPMQFSVARP